MNMTLYISIIFVSMLIGWILTLIEEGKHNFPYGLIGGMIGVVIPAILLICVINEQPKAMDVYKGITTLEITYRDGVPMDSVVVFKYKEK